MADGRPPEKDAKQRTLFDLQKVVRLDTSAVCFSAGAVHELKKTLLDPSSPKWLLLQTLRKLDCFRFEFGDLVSTEVGVAVSTLQQHPKLEVAKLAHSLQNKWRALVEDALFKRLPYDAELASTIPEDPPAPPPPPPEEAAGAQQQAADRAAQLEARRQQELDFLLSESDSEEGDSGRDSDPDFRPGGRSGGSKGKLRSKRKQKG